MNKENYQKKNVFLFLVLVLILTVTTHFLAPKAEGNNPVYMMLIMWSPGLAALITCLVNKRSLKGLGWRFSAKWMGIAWLIPVAYGFVAYGLIWILDLGDVPNPTFLERARFTLGMDSENDMLIIISAFFYLTVINLIPNMIMSFGEELGWRGFLVPELNKWVGFKKTALYSGVIWAAWHLPGILSGNYGGESTPLWYQLICFFIMVLAGAVILAWIRLESGSVWPAVAFHAVHNGAIQMFFNRITLDTGNTEYFTGEFGIALAVTSGFTAFYFYRKPINQNQLNK